MTPEYGCTCTLFPVDERTLEYLRLTGNDAEQVALVEAYAKAQGFWHDLDAPERTYADVVELDLSTVTRSIAGPSRPHDRIGLCEAQERFHAVCAERGLDLTREVHVQVDGQECALTHGALAIAAVTSCTTATDPSMMVAAGLVATQRRRRAGCVPSPWVKTHPRAGQPCHGASAWSAAGLMDGLRQLGFHTCGFGCMSCIGNSGPVQGTLHRGGERHRTGERPFRQPQLRRPHFPRRGAELPGCAGRGGGLCAGRHHGRGPGARRAWPRRTGTAGAPGRHLALRRRGGRAGDRARHGRPVCDGHARPVRGGRRVGSARRGAERCVLMGRPVHLCAPASLLRRHGSLSRRAGADRGGSRAGAFGGLHHDRPHLARRVASPPTLRPRVTCKNTASLLPISTRTGRAAATTRS